MARSYRRRRIPARHGAARPTGRCGRAAGFSRALAFRQAVSAALPRRYVCLESGHSSARLVRAHARCLPPPRRTGRDRAGRGVAPTACAATHAERFSNLVPFLPAWSSLPGELRAGCMAMARHEMIIDHADGLHESVDDGWPHEFKTACDELL